MNPSSPLWASLELHPGTAAFFGLPERVLVPAGEGGTPLGADGRPSDLPALADGLARAVEAGTEMARHAEVHAFLRRWPRYQDLDRYLKQGNLTFAEAVAKSIIADAGPDPPSLSVLSLARAGEAQWEEALSLAEQAHALAPGHPPLQLQLALVRAGAGRREEALELLGGLAWRSRLASAARLWRHEVQTRTPEVLARGIAKSLRVLAAPDPVPEAGPELEAAFPGNPEVLYRKILASRSEGDADPPVERELGRILELDPDHHPARMALAGRHLAGGEAGSAREVVEAGLERDADDPQLLALLGQVLEVEGRGERAATAYRAVFDGPLSRVPGPALVTAVHGLLRLGSGEEVATLLTDLIEARPGDPLPHQLLAEREAANGDRDAAERRLREAQKTCGPLPSLVYALGDLLRRRGRTVEAEGLFQVLTQRHPESAWGHRGLGDLVVETSPAAALEHYETARRLDPAVTLPGFDYLLGVAALRAGDVPRARSALRRAVAVEPDNARYWCDLGACSFHAGDLEGAVAATERALRLRPGHPGFLHNLAVYLQERFRREPLRQAGAGFRAWRLRRRVAREESKGWTRDLWTPGPREAPPRDE